MLRAVALLAALVLAAAPAAAQPRFEVMGVVVDTAGVGLGGATVMVLDVDSTLLGFGLSRADGRFRVERVPAGERLLQVTFVGFEPYTRAITLADGPLDVGRVVLREAVAALEELVVTADHIPLLVRRDTLDYNAAAFRVPPGAPVEELLRRLPGIEVDRDGTIRAQGEVVSQILVDGRAFFGNDPTVATRNLPADAIDRVLVYDRLSETAELTGIPDGVRRRTIDLQLRPDRRRGAFGNLAGALGDPARFDARGSANRFRAGSQLALLAHLNNVNELGFRPSELLGFAGGIERFQTTQRLLPLAEGPAAGFATTLSGGLNALVDLGPHTTLRASYVAYGLDRERETLTRQQDLLGGRAAARTDETSRVDTGQRSHRFQLEARHRFGEGHDLRLETNAEVGLDTHASQRTRATEPLDRTSRTENTRQYDWTRRGLAGDALLVYRRRLAPGRTLVAELRGAAENRRSETDLDAHTAFFRGGDLLTTEELRQLQDLRGRTARLGQSLTFTEPLGGGMLLELRAQHRVVAEARDQATFDLVDGARVPNVPLSFDLEQTYRYLAGGLTLRRAIESLTLGLGADVQRAELLGPVEAANPNRTAVRLLPRATLRYTLGPSHHLQLDYTTGTREPTLRERRPVPDVQDPLDVYTGNPALRSAYEHRLRATYTRFEAFTGTLLTATAGFQYTVDAIVPTRTVDEDLRQRSSVTNADGVWSAFLWLHGTRPLPSLGVRAGLSTNVTLARSLEFVNGERNPVTITRLPLTLSLGTLRQAALQAEVSATATLNVARYTLQPALDRTFVNWVGSGDVEYALAEGLRVGTALRYEVYAAEVFGTARRVPLLGAHAAWRVPRSRAELRLEGRDLLDRNVGVTFANTPAYLREQQTASLGRHVLLRLVYHFGPASAQPRITIRRAG